MAVKARNDMRTSSKAEAVTEMKEQQSTKPGFTPAQQSLSDLWGEHLRDEFATKDATATLDTMVPDAYVNHIPVLAVWAEIS
jgi:hypothetical protein